MCCLQKQQNEAVVRLILKDGEVVCFAAVTSTAPPSLQGVTVCDLFPPQTLSLPACRCTHKHLHFLSARCSCRRGILTNQPAFSVLFLSSHLQSVTGCRSIDSLNKPTFGHSLHKMNTHMEFCHSIMAVCHIVTKSNL